VIKTGAHLPYDDKSPPSLRPFSGGPTSPREATRESYRNAIHWATDRFLEELSRSIEATGRECLVIYTSDHGQWLPDDGDERAVAPHATVLAPPSEQASVPLVLLAFGPRTRAALEARLGAALVDAASGYAIFPTVLQAAGFAPADTATRYAPSLFEAGAGRPPRSFVSGNIFASHSGAFALNPGVGDECFSNAFDVDALRSAP
jgi:arylsulfatase A-like enzyme